MLKEKCMILLIIDLSIDIRLCARWRKTLLFFPIQYICFLRTARAARPTFRIDLLMRFILSALVSDSCRCHTFIARGNYICIEYGAQTHAVSFMHIRLWFVRSVGTRHWKWNHRGVKRKYHYYLYLSIESITTSALPFCARKCLRMRAN